MMRIGNATRRVGWAAASAGVALTCALAGCSKKPGGQVVAVINSDDVTQQELRTEAEAAGVPPSQNFTAYAPVILDRVIQRDLLADYAKQQKLNLGPDFVARRRQIEQALLANLATQQLLRKLPPPTPGDISAYIQGNPLMFKDRERLALDQVRFPSPPTPADIKTLTALGSLDAIVARLHSRGVQVGRGTATIDTGTVDPALASQVAALPNGRPFDISLNGVTYISVITGRSPAPMPEASWSANAANAFQRVRAQTTIANAIKDLRAKAHIQFAPGYALKTPAT